MTEAITSREENKAVVRPAGNVVASSVGDLRSLMRRMIDDGVHEMVLDLADVRMMDSRGIGLLIAAHNSLTALGGHLSLIHTSNEIFDLLRTMRIHQHISVTRA